MLGLFAGDPRHYQPEARDRLLVLAWAKCSKPHQVLHRSHRDHILNLSDERLPLQGDEFDSVPGVWVQDGKRLLIQTKFLRQRPEGDTLLAGIQDLGRLDLDEGKFSNKAPRAMPGGRRA